MNEREELLMHKDPMKLLIKFSIPAILGMVVNALYNVVDRMYIGHIPDVGGMALTGVGITFPIMNIILGVAMLVGVGAGAKLSIDMGSGKKENAERILGTAIVLQVLAAIVVGAIGIAFLNPLLTMFGATANTIGYAKDYIVIILSGCIFNISGYVLTSTIRAEGNPKIASIIILLCAVTNIILDPIFIFGLGMGVKGAAVATVISQAVGCILGVTYYKSNKSMLKIRRVNMKWDLEMILPILAIGMAPFLMQFAASGVSLVANRSLLQYGDDLAIGAMAIINSVVMLCLMPVIGINQGAQPILGYNYGAKLYTRVKQTIVYACIAGTAFSCLGWVLTQVFTEQLVKAFNNDPQLLAITTQGLKLWTAFLCVVGFQIVASNYYQAIGKARVAIILSLMRQVIILIPAMIIIPRLLGLKGIWVAGALSDLLSTLITVVLFVIEFRHLNQLIKEQQMTKDVIR